MLKSLSTNRTMTHSALAKKGEPSIIKANSGKHSWIFLTIFSRWNLCRSVNNSPRTRLPGTCLPLHCSRNGAIASAPRRGTFPRANARMSSMWSFRSSASTVEPCKPSSVSLACTFIPASLASASSFGLLSRRSLCLLPQQCSATRFLVTTTLQQPQNRWPLEISQNGSFFISTTTVQNVPGRSLFGTVALYFFFFIVLS
mmetsp:Transcript_16893/g.36716  ORF Transcript_16893/g.36716 Transcript_16893/m.36716 type:complete len:200 (+) Transcript_16893:343-942(+)